MSSSTENQLLGDWTYELSLEELAKVGGGYPNGWDDHGYENWRIIGQDAYGDPVRQYRFGPYGTVNW